MQPTLNSTGPAVHFLNVEYFFRVLYDLIYARHSVALEPGNLLIMVAHWWLVVTILAYAVSLAAIWALIFYTLRYWQIKKEDEQRYTTIAEPEEHDIIEHARWAYIKQLIESPQESDWRQAIIEADIMLDELLQRQGYPGATLGDRLQAAKFGTLQQAWDAHKVRNDIAHQGSAYQLSDSLAYRTIGNYEAVFREFNEI